MKRFLCLGLVFVLYVLIIGCGQTFRPIIIPNPPSFPNPAAAHTVVSINDNGGLVAGSAMVMDVSGDSVASIANTDIHPVFAAQQSAGEILVLNQAVTGLNVPTTTCLVTVGSSSQVFDVCPTLTSLNFATTSIGSTSTVTLPIYSSPNFVAVAPSATTAYVTLPTYPTDPTNPQTTIVPSVGVLSVSSTSKALVGTVPVVNNPSPGANPYALAVTPDNTKLYVADDSSPCSNPPAGGICAISAFNTNNTNLSLSTRGVSGSLSSPPIWLSARSDDQAVFALEASGALAYISIASTAGPDVLTEDSAISVPGAVKMVYDGNLNRLYIPGGNQVAIVDAAQPVPATLATIAITGVPSSSRSAPDPCAGTTATTLQTIDVATLPDGSRAYAGTYYETAVAGVNTICPQVTVIDTTSNSIKSAIAIPGFAAFEPFCANTRFRLTMAAGGDSTRAYLASCDGGMVNIIDTSDDSYIESQPVPASTQTGSGGQNLPQNPVLLLAGP